MRASPDGTNFTSQIKPCNSELSCGLFVALLGIAQKKHDLDGGRSDPVLSWNNSVSDVSRPLAPFTKPLSSFIPLPIRHQLSVSPALSIRRPNSWPSYRYDCARVHRPDILRRSDGVPCVNGKLDATVAAASQ